MPITVQMNLFAALMLLGLASAVAVSLRMDRARPSSRTTISIIGGTFVLLVFAVALLLPTTTHESVINPLLVLWSSGAVVACFAAQPRTRTMIWAAFIGIGFGMYLYGNTLASHRECTATSLPQRFAIEHVRSAKLESYLEYLCMVYPEFDVELQAGWLHDSIESLRDSVPDGATSELGGDLMVLLEDLEPFSVATARPCWHTWLTGLRSVEWSGPQEFWFPGGNLCEKVAEPEVRERSRS